MALLTTDEVRAFYDAFGSKQDRQAFYEDPALDQLVPHGAFGDAREVFELGCGTGRLALDLLRNHLPAEASYLGVDLSATMVELARARLAPLGGRAKVLLSSGEGALPLQDRSVDRVVATYVLDLMDGFASREFLAEARRALRPGGRLCLAGITDGSSVASRFVMGAWKRIFAWRPSWVGGCRPLRIAETLRPPEWEVRFHTVVEPWGVASEVVVASPRA